MSEFKPREVPLWEQFARALGFGDDSIQRYELRGMGRKEQADTEQETFRTHMARGGSILDAPLPGANPEVPDLGTGMAGVVMAGGGQALPPGIRPQQQTGFKAPGGRSKFPPRVRTLADRTIAQQIKEGQAELELHRAARTKPLPGREASLRELKEESLRRLEGGKRLAMEDYKPSGRIKPNELSKWFGKPQPGSNAYNDGTPLPLYHGTRAEFTDLKPSKDGAAGPGIYLSKSPDLANTFAGNREGSKVLQSYARGKFLKIPFNELINAKEWNAKARKEGYDGVDTGMGELVVFNSRNITSAIGLTK